MGTLLLNCRTQRVLVICVVVSILLLGGIQTGDCQDLRASRETLTIIFNGASDSETNGLKASLVKELSGRFEIVSTGGDNTLTLTGTLNGAPPKKGKPDNRSAVYRVVFKRLNKSPKVLFDKLSETSGLGTRASMVVRKLTQAYPLESRVVSVEGDDVYIDMGSNVGLKPGNRFRVLTAGGDQKALLKIDHVSAIESRGHIISGGDVYPGLTVSPQLPIRGGIGVEYTHFTLSSGFKNYTGRDVLVHFRYDPPKARPWGIIVSTGYIDHVEKSGWHVINIDFVMSFELRTDFLFLEVGGGGGFSITELRSDDPDPNSEDTTGTISMKTAAIYDGFAGLRFMFARQIAITARLGYLGYTRYVKPDQPVLRVGMSWVGI